METNETSTPEERMKERKEHPVLCLRRKEGDATFRYLVAVSDGPPNDYSVYVEYTDGTRHTTGEISHFSSDRDTAESFCSLLERFSVTPLSLVSVYEDIYTP